MAVPPGRSDTCKNLPPLNQTIYTPPSSVLRASRCSISEGRHCMAERKHVALCPCLKPSHLALEEYAEPFLSSDGQGQSGDGVFTPTRRGEHSMPVRLHWRARLCMLSRWFRPVLRGRRVGMTSPNLSTTPLTRQTSSSTGASSLQSSFIPVLLCRG